MKKFFLILALAVFLPLALHAQNAGVALLWEAQTYVPPLYKGKALHVKGGALRIVAFPDPSLGTAASLNYRWKIDGTVLGDASGPGRTILDVKASMFDTSPLVTVDVLDALGDVLAVGAVRIPLVEPQVLLYENKPLGGINFARAAGPSETLTEQETTFEAYPYFFSVASRRDPALQYQWSLNSQRLANNAEPEITLQTASSSGSATVNLSLRHLVELLQSAAATLRVNFRGEDV